MEVVGNHILRRNRSFPGNESFLYPPDDLAALCARTRAVRPVFGVDDEIGRMHEDGGTSAVDLVQKVEHLVGELAVIGTRLDDERRGRRAVGVAQKARRGDLRVIDWTWRKNERATNKISRLQLSSLGREKTAIADMRLTEISE